MMKRLTLLFSLIFILSGSLSAQTVLDVEAKNSDGSPNFLNVFMADNPADEYRLVTTDAVYFIDATVNIDAAVKITGVPASDGRIPAIQPVQAADQTDLQTLFLVGAADATVHFENLYILGVSHAGTRHGEVEAINVTADNVHLIVDGCVFDEVTQFIIQYTGAWDKFTIRNSVVRNGSKEANNPWVSELLRNINPANPTGDVIIQNNTFLGLGAYVSCTNRQEVTSSLLIDHNTVVYGTKNVFFQFGATDAQITNNIFYSTFSVAGNNASIGGAWDESDAGSPTAVISFDTLSFPFTNWAPDLVGDADSVSKGEARRNVVVKNNAYFWPSEVTDFITAFNDTASDDRKVQMPQWINERTQGMFDNDAMWPGFVLEGNQNVDPGFGSDITGLAANFTAYLHNAYVGGAAQVDYHYAKNEPNGTQDWAPVWPLPEAEFLKYSNTDLQTAGTDDKPLGDMQWFDIKVGVEKVNETLPESYNLSQNYPNPFNPTTVIEYSIQEAGHVSLSVFNVLGQEVTSLVNLEQSVGTYKVNFDATNLTSGMYFYTLTVNNVQLTKKMMLIK